jgi:hypothetical protein
MNTCTTALYTSSIDAVGVLADRVFDNFGFLHSRHPVKQNSHDIGP